MSSALQRSSGCGALGLAASRVDSSFFLDIAADEVGHSASQGR